MNLKHLLGAQSDFSIGQSLLQIDHLVAAAKDKGYESVALVDDMSLHGMVDFSNKAKKAGIRPIIGCRIRVMADPTYRKPSKASGIAEQPNPMCIIKAYALSEKGVSSLLKLLSAANSPEYFYYFPRVGLNDVLEMEDVAITTGDFYNVFHLKDHAEFIDRLIGRFGSERVFVELTPINTPLFDTLNARALRYCAASSGNVNTIVGHPSLYREPGDAASLDVLSAVTTNTKMDVSYRPIQFVRGEFAIGKPELLIDRMKAAAKRIAKFNGIMDSAAWVAGVANIDRLASMCAYEFKKQPVCLPEMAEDEFKALGKKCIEGWKRRLTNSILGYMPRPEDLPVYRERLQYELGVLKHMGFSGYFLLAEDLVMWAKTNGIIVGPGRGSCFLPGHRVICDKSGLTKAIEDFSIGDTVLAHDGSTQEVIATLEFDRDEDIIELEFSNGVKIECTKDHKFFTRNRGWVVAEDLNSEDEFDDVSELAQRLESETPPSAG